MTDIIKRDNNAAVSIKDDISLLPVQEQSAMLAEYAERRNTFRKWLLGQLVEGVHYGFPPGCAPKMDRDGNILQWSKKENAYVPLSKKQWQAKPSLYKAGAAYIVDLLRLRATYESDAEAWRMLGAKNGMLVRTCTLTSADGKYVGKGTGAFSVGQKDMNENAAIKMADKSALVAAVINSVATCADLFTQDIEDAAASVPIKRINDKQLSTVLDLCEATGTPAANICKWAKIETLEDLPDDRYEETVALLQRKIKK